MAKQMTRTERKQETYKELKDMLYNLKSQANLTILMNDSIDFIYAHIITERDTIISVSAYHFGGYRVSYKYKPSGRNGTGCICSTPDGKEVVGYINTVEELNALESSGIAFANRLGATHYKNSEEFLDKLWNRDNLIEL